MLMYKNAKVDSNAGGTMTSVDTTTIPVSQGLKGIAESGHSFAITALLSALVISVVVMMIINNPSVKGIKALIKYSSDNRLLKVGVDVEKEISNDSNTD